MNAISFIGAGNVAFRMALAFQEKGCVIPHIWNRTPERALKLAKALNSNLSAYTARNAFEAGLFTPVPTGAPTVCAASITDLLDSDLIVIAVSDDAIAEVTAELAVQIHNALICGEEHLPIIVHTSGASDISILDPLKKEGCRCGVFYPMLTLSKSKNVDFKDVPFLLEANDDTTLNALKCTCNLLNSEYFCCDSHQRLMMHIAAVFSCNFTNYLLSLAFETAGKAHSLLLPTTLEMIRKSFLQSPEVALTGPARRGDIKTIEKHMKTLQDAGMTEHLEIYQLITEKIINRNKHD